MVSGTHSSRKNKVDDDSMKKELSSRKGSSRCRSRKTNVSGVMKTSRETSSSNDMNPQSKQKSKHLDIPISPLTPRITNKSERLEKQSTPSPLRRSDRNKKNMSSSCSPKHSVKEFTRKKETKEKNLIQVPVDTEKNESARESVGVKRKIMDARSFKSLFKRQQIKVVFPDVDMELEGQDNISYVCKVDSRESDCTPMENGEDTCDEFSERVVKLLGDEHTIRASDGDLQKSICSLRGSESQILGSSVYLDSSQYCALSSESGEKCLKKKVTVSSSSAKCETCSLWGTCALCNKNKRVGYDSPEQELCSCSATLDEGFSNFSASKGGGDHGAAVSLESFEHYFSRNPYSETNDLEKACVICDKDRGELLFCCGNGCNRCYHLSCLNPPLTYALPGVWHCPWCVYKKFSLGVHSVSKGVESIWDAREVEATNAKGMHRQKQYFVKYHGLAHVHNHWLSDIQLCHENLSLFSNFTAKDQIVKWNSEWTVPHRLLRKRPVHIVQVSASTDTSECHYEWLVKWHGLNYDQSSWELDSACFLSLFLGQKLMKDYEVRLENAKKLNKYHKGSFVALSKLPPGESPLNDSNLLKNVNQLRDCWSNCQNAVVLNNQDRAITAILFIQSLTAMCQPFLIIAASESFSLWEAEFARLAPSVDVVVYSGNRETRKVIRESEFYEEGGCVMLQVLLSSLQTILEDLDVIRCIRWKAIVIDDYQHFVVPNSLKPIKTLASDLRIILINDRKEDTTPEYLNLLPWFASYGDCDKMRFLNFNKDKDSCKLERLLCCNSIESTSEMTKFVEYWVPVQISNYQLELYCDALFNSNALRSSSRSDLVGAIRDIVLTVRKCCDHPYLVDASIQKALFAEQHPGAEILEIGIKASGKLHVLDLMLSKIKTQGLQVLILYQMIVGPEGAEIGDILDDFLCQRFGENTYERVDARVINSRKQAAMDRFNKRETGQFVFLLENRACSSCIKLSSLDLIIIYDSDWNPANDLKALQRIPIDSKIEQIKVFRLYSSCTVEERALVLAKKNLNLSTMQNISSTRGHTYDNLLMWGACYLFNELDEYHAASSSTDLKCLSGKLFLNEVIKEFHAILSDNCETSYINPLISKATLQVGCYKSNSQNFGEAKIQLMDGIEPYMFWRNLLDRKRPQWKHLRGPSPRNRKRVQRLVESPRMLGCKNGDASKNRKRVVSDNANPTSVLGDLTEYPMTEIAGSKAGNNTTVPLPTENSTIHYNPNCIFGESPFHAGDDTSESAERFSLLLCRKSLHGFLQGELTGLCQLLKISDNVTVTARRFLEYVIENYDARSDSPAIMQAFQISLCWFWALISKQEVDKKHSFLLAKQLLSYECTEEQVNSVYSKMQSLIWMYLQCSENANSSKDCLLDDEVISKEPSNINDGLPLSSLLCKQKDVKIEIEGELFNEEHHEAQISLHKILELMVKAAGSEIQDVMKKKMKKCEKRMKKLIQKQEEEVHQVQRTLDKQKVKFEENHILESAVTRSIHDQGSVAIFKLKILDDNFTKKMDEHNLLKDMQLKDLQARHLAAQKEETQKAAKWLAEAIVCSSEIRTIKGPQPLGSLSDGYAGSLLGNSAASSYPSINARAMTIGCNDPSTTLCNLESVNSDNEVGIISSKRLSPVSVEQLNHLNHSSDATTETGSANQPVSEELISCEIQVKELNKEALTGFLKTIFNNVVSHVGDVVLCDASVEGNLTGLPDSMVTKIDGLDKMTDIGLLLHHVSDDEINQHLVIMEQQDQELPVETPSTLQNEVVTLELGDTATIFQSKHEELTIRNHELLDPVSIDASLRFNQSCLSETEHQIQDQERSSFQSSEAGETKGLFKEFISQSSNPFRSHDSHLDLGPTSRFDGAQGIELFGSSPNNVAIVEAVVSTAELPNQFLQLGLDAGHLHGTTNLPVHPIYQVASWNSAPSSLAEPFKDELERLRKEAEQLERTHEDMMSQLRYDCEKEIEEIIAQIRFKYDVKIKDAEAEFISKRNKVEKNQNIVLMNKKLSEAFRSKLDLSSRPGMQQAFPSNFMWRQHQLSSPPSTRHPSEASASGPPPGQQTTAPLQHDMLPHRPILNSISASVASQSVTAPPHVHAESHSRPPLLSGIISAANLHFDREISSPALHLQPSTPIALPRVDSEIHSPASHLHRFRSAAPMHDGGDACSPTSSIKRFRPAAATSTALHQHHHRQKYRCLDQFPECSLHHGKCLFSKHT